MQKCELQYISHTIFKVQLKIDFRSTYKTLSYETSRIKHGRNSLS